MIRKLKRRARFWSFKVIWPLLPVAIILALVVFLSQRKVFGIKQIDCFLDNFPCSLEFEPVLVNLHGQNLFTLKDQTVTEALKRIDPAVDQVSIAKHLPNKVTIAMRRNQALAKVVVTTDLTASGSGALNDPHFYLDTMGHLFALTGPVDAGLPLVKVSADQNVVIGTTALSTKLTELITALNTAYVHWRTLTWFSSERVIVYTDLGPQATVNPSQPLGKTIATLQYILSNLKIGEKLPNSIDLRFDKPVLSY